MAPKLDRIDLKILAHLERNGPMSNRELAELVGLSPSPCLQPEAGVMPSAELLTAMARFNDEIGKAGILEATGRLKPT